MLAKKITLAALAVLFVGAVATGAGFVGQVPAQQTARSQPQDRQAGKPEPSEVAAKTNDAIAKPAPGRMFVVGRVLDPAGKPVPNATTMVYARSKALGNSPAYREPAPSHTHRRRAPTDRGGSTSTRRGPRRRGTTPSAPSRSRQVMAWAASSSIPTPISRPPKSRSGASK